MIDLQKSEIERRKGMDEITKAFKRSMDDVSDHLKKDDIPFDTNDDQKECNVDGI